MSWRVSAFTKHSLLGIGVAAALAAMLAVGIATPHLQHNLLFLQIAAQLAGAPGECGSDGAAGAASLDARSRGLAAYACGEFAAAAASLADAAGSGPYGVINRYFRINSLLAADQSAAAVAELGDSEVRSLFETRGLDLQVERDLLLAVEAGSVDPRVYYTLGEMNSLAQPALAVDYYERGLQHDPARNTAQAQLALAFVARQQHDWPLVQQAYQAAVRYENEPSQRCTILEQAATMSMFEAQNSEQAIAWAQQLRDFCPWTINGWLHLIYFNAYAGHNDQALLWYADAQLTRFAGASALEEARNYVLQNK